MDYLFGQVSIDKRCRSERQFGGNFNCYVGAFGNKWFSGGGKIPKNGICTVHIWQANIQKPLAARMPITQGQVQETGDFELDGVTFPAAEGAD